MGNSNEVKKYHFIYKTINLLNGKYYIGIHSTSNLKDRYLGSGKHLRYSIRKHGIENFKCEILEWVESRNELFEKEKQIVNEDLIKDPMCMNLRIGGDGGFTKEEAVKGRKKCDEILTMRYGSNFRSVIISEFFKKCTEEDIKKFRNKAKLTMIERNYDRGKTFRGKKHTESAKKKIGEANSIHQKGNSNSQYGTYWITNEKENKKLKRGEQIPEGWRRGRLL